MNHPLDDVVAAQKQGVARGVASVCSAHPIVLRAALSEAAADGSVAVVEATSNQVDQFGGYTGMTPADFAAFARQLAEERGLPASRLVLGGDHLGPNTWRTLPETEAMAHAEDLVRAYASAGFTKLHLDCTYPCADDAGPLTDDVVAERAARLLVAAEGAAPDPSVVRYVIGTEVPVPGGASETIDRLRPTSADAARTTLAAHRKAFDHAGHDDAWPRVMALVVQPGVEFDHLRVVDYDRSGTEQLRHVLDDEPHMVFEAHSTDYQTGEHLRQLVEDGWAVLKVGPGLTFALREALFALAAIEAELVPAADRSDLPEVVERRMRENPRWWQDYYPGTPEQQRLARRYSYSDRMRYYWPDEQIETARERLFDTVRDGVPEPLLSQFLPAQYQLVRAGSLAADDPDVLVEHHIRAVMREYADACRTRSARKEAA